jgi:short-subunit dehydrogenase
MKTNTEYTLITGASLGLGREFAIACAKRNMNLILISLPGEKLPVLAEYIAFRYRVKVVWFELDLTKKESLLRLHDLISRQYPVNMIINNAGFGGSRLFECSPLDYLDNMIQLNIRALSLLTRLMIGNLKQQPRAWIMNISSMAAFSPMPFKTLYPASKAFVYYFSRGLAEELKDTRISVSVVHPGPMMTNDEVSSRIRKQGFSGRMCLLSIERIAGFCLGEMLKGKKVIIPGFLNRINWILLKLVPLSWQMSLLSRMVKRELSNEIIQLPERNGEVNGYVNHTVPVSTSVA